MSGSADTGSIAARRRSFGSGFQLGLRFHASCPMLPTSKTSAATAANPAFVKRTPRESPPSWSRSATAPPLEHDQSSLGAASPSVAVALDREMQAVGGGAEMDGAAANGPVRGFDRAGPGAAPGPDREPGA